MITALLLVPGIASVGLWFCAGTLARRCSPKCAARAMTLLSVIVALASGLVLCVLACVGLVQLNWTHRFGQWSPDEVSDRFPVPAALALAATCLVVILLALASAHLVRAIRSLTVAARHCRALGPSVGGLVVVDDDRVAAYAVPVSGGRTVISRRLLTELDRDEADAVLAHEHAHLRHRHFLYVQAAELAAAANPLLKSTAVAVRSAVECWADEDAAAAVGSRVCVARAIAKASLSHRAVASPHAALGVGTSSDAVHRVRRLLDDTKTRSGWWLVVMGVAAIACSASALIVGAFAHGVFETAETLMGAGG